MAEQKTAEAEALMSAYLDEQLAPEEAARVEKMLAESPEAREEMSGLQNMLKLVKGLPEVEAPPDFYEKVAKKIRRRRYLRGENLWLLTLPFQVLSVVLILVVAVTYMLLHLDSNPSGQLEKDPTVVPPPAENPAVPRRTLDTRPLPVDGCAEPRESISSTLHGPYSHPPHHWLDLLPRPGRCSTTDTGATATLSGTETVTNPTNPSGDSDDGELTQGTNPTTDIGGEGTQAGSESTSGPTPETGTADTGGEHRPGDHRDHAGHRARPGHRPPRAPTPVRPPTPPRTSRPTSDEATTDTGDDTTGGVDPNCQAPAMQVPCDAGTNDILKRSASTAPPTRRCDPDQEPGHQVAGQQRVPRDHPLRDRQGPDGPEQVHVGPEGGRAPAGDRHRHLPRPAERRRPDRARQPVRRERRHPQQQPRRPRRPQGPARLRHDLGEGQQQRQRRHPVHGLRRRQGLLRHPRRPVEHLPGQRGQRHVLHVVRPRPSRSAPTATCSTSPTSRRSGRPTSTWPSTTCSWSGRPARASPATSPSSTSSR
jgi:hypothetical protein